MADDNRSDEEDDYGSENYGDDEYDDEEAGDPEEDQFQSAEEATTAETADSACPLHEPPALVDCVPALHAPEPISKGPSVEAENVVSLCLNRLLPIDGPILALSNSSSRSVPLPIRCRICSTGLMCDTTDITDIMNTVGCSEASKCSPSTGRKKPRFTNA